MLLNQSATWIFFSHLWVCPLSSPNSKISWIKRNLCIIKNISMLLFPSDFNCRIIHYNSVSSDKHVPGDIFKWSVSPWQWLSEIKIIHIVILISITGLDLMKLLFFADLEQQRWQADWCSTHLQSPVKIWSWKLSKISQTKENQTSVALWSWCMLLIRVSVIISRWKLTIYSMNSDKQ